MASPSMSRSSNSLAAIGSPVLEPIQLAPIPLSHHVGSIALILLGLVLLAIGVALAAADKNLAGGLGAGLPGLAILGTGIALLVERSRQRQALTVHGGGISLQRKGVTRALAFADLSDLSLLDKEVLNNGNPVGRVRKLELRGAGRTLKIHSYVALGASDPVGRAIDDIVARRSESAEGQLASQPLRGKGWTLDGQRLHTKRGEVSLNELACASQFDNQVLLWRRDESEPVVAIPAESANARILLRLAAKRCEGKEAKVAGLGRILFSRGSSTAIKVAAVLLLPTILPGIAAGVAEGGSPSLMVPGLCAGLVIAAAGIGYVFRVRIQVFEAGVRKRGLIATRELRFSEVVGFTQNGVRHYYNGAYTGTSHSMSFDPIEGKPIKHSWRTQGSDEEMDRLREHVSRVVATTLEKLLERSEWVAWSGAVQLTREGIRYRKAKLIGQGEQAFIGYESVRYAISEGTLHVFGPGSDKAVFTLPCASHNFFPGLALMERLASKKVQQQAG